MTVTTRRSEITVQAMVVKTIRPDTVFIPYHWPGETQREPADPPDARSAQQDSGVQGFCVPTSKNRRPA